MVSKTLALLACLLWSCVTLAAPPMKTWHDVAYGPDPQQRFDVYAPQDAKAAPLIFMVHGGAWTVGPWELHPLALLSKQTDELDGSAVGAGEPVRCVGVEFRGFAGRGRATLFGLPRSMGS